jgi:hypothetical protein
MPLPVQDACISPHKGMLISSPTHAFILYPGLELIQEGWQENLFTYSWVRDRIIKPGQEFYNAQTLSPAEQSFLVESLEKKLPASFANSLKSTISLSSTPIPLFRDLLGKILPVDLIDSFLHETLPLTQGTDWKKAVQTLLQDLDCKTLSTLLESFPDIPCAFFSAKTLKTLAKAFYMLEKDSFLFSFDLHQHIEKKAIKSGLSPPSTILFADTNWTSQYFGFVVNPGTNQLELWRLDRTGASGAKMSIWQRFLDGTDHSPWNVYTHLFEYT